MSGLASGVVAIAAGYYHTCAVTTAGAAQCWGSDFNGQLGTGRRLWSSMPVDVIWLIWLEQVLFLPLLSR